MDFVTGCQPYAFAYYWKRLMEALALSPPSAEFVERLSVRKAAKLAAKKAKEGSRVPRPRITAPRKIRWLRSRYRIPVGDEVEFWEAGE